MRVNPLDLGNMKPGGAPYFMYMNEMEHNLKVSGVIKDLKQYLNKGGDPNNILQDTMRKHGLSVNDLSQREQDRINDEVFN